MKSRGRKFISHYRPYVGTLVADLACASVVAAITLILPLCVRYVTKNLLEQNISNGLTVVYGMGALMVVLVVVLTLCNVFVDYRGHMMGARMESDMRSELFRHYERLSFGFYDQERTGRLMSRMTNDLLSLSEFYHHGPEDLVIGLLTIVGVFVVSATISTELTFVVLLFVPAMTIYALYFNRKMNAAIRRSRESIAEINAQVEDTLSGIRVVQSFTNEEMETTKFACRNDILLESRRNDYRSSSHFSSGMIGFAHLITVAVVVFGAAAIARAALDLPDLVTYLLYVGILTDPVRRLANFARLYQEGTTSFDRYMDILEVTPDIKDAADAVELEHVRGNVVFQDVSFRYGDSRDYILTNICLDIRAGEYLALVGTSGVGKTTLCSLIPRFYEVSAGSILLDGRNIKDISLRSLRRNIGVVHQDVYLFAGTAADNIRYGRPDAEIEEVIEAARKANAHDFVMALPDGYDTDIGQRGVKLSGGQKQRLSIARVFLKDPPVIILDEATSALDNESERAVRESLERLAVNRTTIVVAHRLSTVRNAQRIVVLNDSGISEQGTHEQLIARGGTYAGLYDTQLRI